MGPEVTSETEPAVELSVCSTTCVALDFAKKEFYAVDVARAREAIEEDHFAWIDLNYSDRAAAKKLLSSLELVSEQLIEDFFSGEAGTQLARYPNYLHLVLAGCRIDSSGALSLERIDVVFAEHFMLTIHEGPRIVLDMVRRDYQGDFLRFAQSPSFLMYELWDDLTDHYVNIQKKLEQRVDTLQKELLLSSDDSVFNHVSEIGSYLLHFRSVLVPARTVLTELSTRRSIFISEATQGFLANMAGTIERVLQDVLVDRDILAQSLNLYMSIITHRTNQAMSKLTIISTVFLPLTFLCGVYGMNFEVLPELKWEHGYLFFWILVAIIVALMLFVMRKAKLF